MSGKPAELARTPRATTALLAVLLASLALAQTPPPRIEIRRGDEVVYSLPEPAGALRVLFVGNSLTYYNDMPWLFSEVVASRRPQPPVVTRFSGASGRTLAENWQRGDARRLLRTEHWDYVVLQEQSSTLLLNPQEHEEFLGRFVAEARRRGAKPVLFATWPRERELDKLPALRDGYRREAAERGIAVAPVGAAWEAAIAAGVDPYRDGLHANLAGSYLSACVFAAEMLGVDPRGAVHTFDIELDHPQRYRLSLIEERLSPETARRLQEIAWRTVRRAKSGGGDATPQ